MGEKVLDDFASRFERLEAGRKECLTAPGSIEKYLYLVTEGVQRVYHISDSGKESTIVFTYAPSFGGVLDSFLLQQPSSYYYETLTPSVFYRMNAKDLEDLRNTHGEIDRFLSQGLALNLSGVIARMTELQSATSEEKFRNLLKRSPHILQLIPHKYIANYIGVDPTNFSKLINQVRID